MKNVLVSAVIGVAAFLAVPVARASEWNSTAFDLYPGDFDGDGSTDVLYVAKGTTGRSGIALSNGVEWVAGAQSWDSDGFGIQWHSNAYLPVIGDFNWDGRDDIFLQRQTPGDHILMLAQVDGTFAGSSQAIANSRAGLVWSPDQHRIIALEGKSSDPAHPKGHRLFLQAATPGGSNAIIDTGSSQLIGTTIVGSAWSDGYRGFNWNLRRSLVYSGDFNGDGEGDLLIQAKPTIVMIDYDPPFPIPVSAPGSFGIVYSPVASGITDFWDRRSAGVDWSASHADLVIGDFNGDGKDDVLVHPKGATSASLVLTNSATNLLSISTPVAISFAGSSAEGGNAYRIVAANINGGASEHSFGVYLQGSTAAALDLIAHTIATNGGVIATVAENGTSQFAGHSEKAFTPALRYNLAGQVTGAIAPDPDGNGPLKYQAVRNTYQNGLLVKVESGELQRWVNDTVLPSNWEQATSFTKFVISEYSYDQYGRKSIERVRRGDTGSVESLVQYNYDSASRVRCRAVRMNKAEYANLPDACQKTAEGEYGPDRISRFSYNSLDLLVTEERGVDTPLVQVYVENEWSGRLLRFQKDANGNKTELEYDSFHRLHKRIYPHPLTVGSLNINDYEEFTYEPTGRVKTERKRSGAVITYSYDANNRVIKKDLSEPSSKDIYYDYYPSGIERSARFDSGSGPGVTNLVDAFGRLQWTRLNNSSATAASGPSRMVSYEYDDNGNKIKVTHPDNQFFGYAFDGLNRSCGVAELAVPATCDPQGLMVAVSYRPDGGRSTLSHGGTTATYEANGIGQLERFTLNLPIGSSDDLTTEFHYTPAGQIRRQIQSNNSYAYVGNANRTGAYLRNGLNQTVAVASQNILHDANGNLTTDPGLAFSMTYDMENRLVATNGAPAVTSSFTYEPKGRLAQLTVGSSTREFVYDGVALIAEYEGGSVKRRYVHGNRTDEPWVEYIDNQVGPGNRRHLFADYQGSIVARSHSAGENLQKLSYDSFGIPHQSNEGRFSYTGQLSIKELGLLYYKARVYSPALGRFLQTDPMGNIDGPNLYAYVGNNPVSARDPSGKFVVAIPIAFEVAAWTGAAWRAWRVARAVAAANAVRNTVVVTGGIALGATALNETTKSEGAKEGEEEESEEAVGEEAVDDADEEEDLGLTFPDEEHKLKNHRRRNEERREKPKDPEEKGRLQREKEDKKHRTGRGGADETPEDDEWW
jgi:RHS repeat-associated protein